jgi:hypothetical protein
LLYHRLAASFVISFGVLSSTLNLLPAAAKNGQSSAPPQFQNEQPKTDTPKLQGSAATTEVIDQLQQTGVTATPKQPALQGSLTQPGVVLEKPKAAPNPQRVRRRADIGMWYRETTIMTEKRYPDAGWDDQSAQDGYEYGREIHDEAYGHEIKGKWISKIAEFTDYLNAYMDKYWPKSFAHVMAYHIVIDRSGNIQAWVMHDPWMLNRFENESYCDKLARVAFEYASKAHILLFPKGTTLKRVNLKVYFNNDHIPL